MAQLAQMYLESYTELNSFSITLKDTKMGKEPKQNSQISAKKCFECGKLGYITKDCRVKKKTWKTAVTSAVSEDIIMLVKDQLCSKDVKDEEASGCVLHICEH